MKPHFKVRFRFYGIRASSKKEAVSLAIAEIKKDPEGFVLSAEEDQSDRSIVSRLIFG
jgi:hypothetical protein